MSLIFVDCEAWGACPATGQLTEFGAVDFYTRRTFHGVIIESTPDPENPAMPLKTNKPELQTERIVFARFNSWIRLVSKGRPIFVSDNPAYDFQWINDGFCRTIGTNPFGHSARRIGDFYAGLVKDFYTPQNWKRLRVTEHTHHPVDDAMGNVEAFERLLKGEI